MPCRNSGGKPVVNDKLAADDAVGLGVPATLEAAGLPQQAHLFVEAPDDRLEPRLFIRDRPFLGEGESFVRALAVDQGRRQPRDRIAQARRRTPGAQRDRTRRSRCTRKVERSASPSRKAEPVLARGADRLAFEFTATRLVSLRRSSGTRSGPACRGRAASCRTGGRGSRRNRGTCSPRAAGRRDP